MLVKIRSIYDTTNRVFGLDLLRCIAIVLVVMGHARWMTETFSKPIRAALHGSGILGVELFFVLSGFLIGGILLKLFENHHFHFRFPETKGFWIRRWFRTLPNYYLFLIIYILFYGFRSDAPDNMWRYVFFLQNIWNTPAGFFEESWSLCIEELSYLVAPLALVVLTSISSLRKKSTFLTVTILLIAAFTLFRIYYSANEVTGAYNWNRDIREVALIRLDAIFYGFVAAYIAAVNPKFWIKSRYLLFVLGLAGVLGLMAFQVKISENENKLIADTLFFTGLSISIACLIPLLSSIKSIKWTFAAKWITSISILSYSIYLINGGLLSHQLKELTKEGMGFSSIQFAGMYIGYWIACIVLSGVIFLFFEKPMTKLRDRF